MSGNAKKMTKVGAKYPHKQESTSYPYPPPYPLTYTEQRGNVGYIAAVSWYRITVVVKLGVTSMYNLHKCDNMIM